MVFQFGNHNSINYGLSCPPDFNNDDGVEDAVLRSDFEGGYQQTRPRFTRLRRTFVLPYNSLLDADKTVLENLYAATKGADSFTYTHWKTGTTYTVRFKKPVNFRNISFGFWSATIELQEV